MKNRISKLLYKLVYTHNKLCDISFIMYNEIWHNESKSKMKNEVITVGLANGDILTYLRLVNTPKIIKDYEGKKYKIQKNNADLRHKLRIKEAVFGRLFAWYNNEMNFDYAIEKGSVILIDKRCLID